MPNSFPNRETVGQLRKDYPIGCRVELIHMGADPFSRLKPGNQGTVRHIDDAGTIFVSWDCGSGLGIVFGVDSIRRIDAAQKEEGKTE